MWAHKRMRAHTGKSGGNRRGSFTWVQGIGFRWSCLQQVPYLQAVLCPFTPHQTSVSCSHCSFQIFNSLRCILYRLIPSWKNKNKTKAIQQEQKIILGVSPLLPPVHRFRGRNQVYWVYTGEPYLRKGRVHYSFLQVVAYSQGEPEQEPGGRNWSRDCAGVLLLDLLLCLPYLLAYAAQVHLPMVHRGLCLLFSQQIRKCPQCRRETTQLRSSSSWACLGLCQVDRI